MKREKERRGGAERKAGEASQDLAKAQTKNRGAQAGGPRATHGEQARGSRQPGTSTGLKGENYDICMAAKGHIFSKFESDLPHTAPSRSRGLSAGSGSRSVDQMYSVIAESLLPSYL